MKEIKAYIRRCCVNKLVTALEEAGAPGITIVDIHPVGYGYEPNCFEEHFEDAYSRYAHLRIVKFEVVCADRDLDRLLAVIQRECRTGAKGDGMIFVADVAQAIRIRDGDSGEPVLRSSRAALAEGR
jgi:nitrogen regulatory protein P-II 1